MLLWTPGFDYVIKSIQLLFVEMRIILAVCNATIFVILIKTWLNTIFYASLEVMFSNNANCQLFNVLGLFPGGVCFPRCLTL